jgi:phosphoribosylamine--glycine ligase
VIEFNARFGDPETQVVLPRLLTPLSELLLATANGSLSTHGRPVFSAESAVTVVLASEGYPEAPVTGREITGIDEALVVPGVTIDHAATARLDDRLVATGGRVLSVVATGDGFTQARDRAYEALSKITLEGGHYRHDIAEKVAR